MPTTELQDRLTNLGNAVRNGYFTNEGITTIQAIAAFDLVNDHTMAQMPLVETHNGRCAAVRGAFSDDTPTIVAREIDGHAGAMGPEVTETEVSALAVAVVDELVKRLTA